jgi:hypothetical protein
MFRNGRRLRDGEVEYKLATPGIPRYQASFRIFLEDEDFFTKEHLVIGSYSFWRLAGLFIRALGNFDNEELASLCSNSIANIIWCLFDEKSLPVPLNKFDMVHKALNEDDSSLPNVNYQLMLHANERRHFYTRKGYLGFGHKGSQKGDLVCLLQGSCLPVILRRIEDYYVHVSTCFALGLMDGEVAELLAEEKASMQQFNIH